MTRKFYPILALGFFLAACASHASADDAKGFRDSFRWIDPARWYISSGWANGSFQSCEWWKGAVAAGDGGMSLRLGTPGGTLRPVSCPEIHTKTHLGYGLFEARMRTAAGSGLNTAFFTYIGPPTGSPEWNEIDFEFLGKDPHTVQLNYYVKGKPQLGKIIRLGFDASKQFHDYAFDWTPKEIRWYVDGKQVYATPAGVRLPYIPAPLYFSLWSGAKSENAWMGPFHYSQPVTATVAWAAYTPIDAPCRFPQSLKCKK
ncbi:MAG TPA: family 16 glycosylhydrolase [Alphaproteobacteria bacterium]|nr:family 16 glycosylhydrolase [Alphaproteobacteria bacterium]